jgi:GR25 family glycosyltransferase involved in LPS biosynthesis
MEAVQNFPPHYPLNTAVLFLIFNRLDTTKQVFEAIRQARPPRLYVAADGHRPDHAGEDEKVREVRNYVLNNIDWNCEVKTLFRDRNMGCGVAVSNAIDWFFEFEEAGIIFEDDVLPDPSFFTFCEELLQRYRDELQIMIISGNYFAGEKHRPTTSYYFSKYPHMWGWATWRRAWKCNDRKMIEWPKIKQTNFLRQLADGDKYFINYWSKIFDMVHAGRTDIWDYHFTFACWVNHGLSIMPGKNLVKNIGFGTDGTHTFNDDHWIAKLPLQRIEFPLIHPMSVERNIAADRWSDRHVFGLTFISSLKSWLVQQPGGDVMARMYRFFKRILQGNNKVW